MREELKRRLYHRELEAFGIMAAPEMRHEFEKISPAMFHAPDIDWKQNAVSGGGYKYVCVEVGLPTITHILEREVLEPARTDRLPGRPSKAQEREAAILGVLGEGVALDSMSRKDACDQVRKYAKERLNANIEVGYDNQTIQPDLVSRTRKT